MKEYFLIEKTTIMKGVINKDIENIEQAWNKDYQTFQIEKNLLNNVLCSQTLQNDLLYIGIIVV